MKFGIATLLVSMALAAPALTAPASTAPEACTSISDSNLPPAFAAWARPAVAAKAGATRATATRIQPNTAVEATLLPAITPAIAPEQERKPENAHAGLLLVKIPAAGNWRVGLSAPAWLDVIGPEGAVKSTAHGHMAPCTTLKKAVEFPLKAGDYLLQISGNPGPAIKLLVSPAP